MLLRFEAILHWLAVVIYAASTVLFIYGLSFRKEKWVKIGTIAALGGLAIHLVALGARWTATGHAPFLARYENMSVYAMISVLIYLLLQYKVPALRLVGVFVLPVSMLTLGLALTSPSAVREVPETFNIVWSIVHIIFAQLSFGSALVGSGLSVLYILKKRALKKGTLSGVFQRITSLEELDILSYQFQSFAFLAIGVMVASGAVWANFAWGRYWGWDPVENWSLFTWLFYGGYLHLHRIHGWKGTKLAWLSLTGFILVFFILVGIVLVFPSIHQSYNG